MKPKVTEAEVYEAIGVILSDKQAYSKSLNWAVNYMDIVKRLQDLCIAAMSMEGEDLRVQCLYILGNITSWRHPEAPGVRKTLKAFANRR